MFLILCFFSFQVNFNISSKNSFFCLDFLLIFGEISKFQDWLPLFCCAATLLLCLLSSKIGSVNHSTFNHRIFFWAKYNETESNENQCGGPLSKWVQKGPRLFSWVLIISVGRIFFDVFFLTNFILDILLIFLFLTSSSRDWSFHFIYSFFVWCHGVHVSAPPPWIRGQWEVLDLRQ